MAMCRLRIQGAQAHKQTGNAKADAKAAPAGAHWWCHQGRCALEWLSQTPPAGRRTGALSMARLKDDRARISNTSRVYAYQAVLHPGPFGRCGAEHKVLGCSQRYDRRVAQARKYGTHYQLEW